MLYDDDLWKRDDEIVNEVVPYDNDLEKRDNEVVSEVVLCDNDLAGGSA